MPESPDTTEVKFSGTLLCETQDVFGRTFDLLRQHLQEKRISSLDQFHEKD